jgi:hypothetical protein
VAGEKNVRAHLGLSVMTNSRGPTAIAAAGTLEL